MNKSIDGLIYVLERRRWPRRGPAFRSMSTGVSCNVVAAQADVPQHAVIQCLELSEQGALPAPAHEPGRRAAEEPPV